MIRSILLTLCFVCAVAFTAQAQQRIAAEQASTFVNVLDLYPDIQSKGAEVKAARMTYATIRNDGEQRTKTLQLNGGQLTKRAQALIQNLTSESTLTVRGVVVIIDGKEQRLDDVIITH